MALGNITGKNINYMSTMITDYMKYINIWQIEIEQQP